MLRTRSARSAPAGELAFAIVITLLALVPAGVTAWARGFAAPSTIPGTPPALAAMARVPAVHAPPLPAELQALGHAPAANARLEPWQRDLMERLGRPPRIGASTPG